MPSSRTPSGVFGLAPWQINGGSFPEALLPGLSMADRRNRLRHRIPSTGPATSRRATRWRRPSEEARSAWTTVRPPRRGARAAESDSLLMSWLGKPGPRVQIPPSPLILGLIDGQKPKPRSSSRSMPGASLLRYSFRSALTTPMRRGKSCSTTAHTTSELTLRYPWTRRFLNPAMSSLGFRDARP